MVSQDEQSEEVRRSIGPWDFLAVTLYYRRVSRITAGRVGCITCVLSLLSAYARTVRGGWSQCLFFTLRTVRNSR